MGTMRNAYKILLIKPEGRKHLGDLGVDGRRALKWTSNKYGARMWRGLICSGTGASDGLW
jgi:hypothetical protein